MSKFEIELEDFNKYIKEHEDWFNKNVPVNPIISKDDEWYYEDEWDEDYKQTIKGERGQNENRD